MNKKIRSFRVITLLALSAGAAPSELWSKTFGSAGGEIAHSVEQTKDDGYIIAGQTISYGARNYNAWLIKTDENGHEQWNRTFRGVKPDEGYAVQQTLDGGYILAGDAFPLGADDRNAWLIKVSRETTGTEDLTESRINPIDKATGFEVALVIIVLLIIYTNERKGR